MLAQRWMHSAHLTAIVDTLDPAKSKAIRYDSLNRLVQVAEGVDVAGPGVPLPVEDEPHDGEGNRLASHLSGLSSSNAHNQLLEDGSYTYAYDARGNRVSRTAKATGAVETYAYDSQNRLVGYTSPTTTATYAYDALDRRIAKVVDGVVEAHVHDAWALRSTIASDVVLDFEGGALVRRWLHSARVDEPLAFERYAGTTAGGSGAAREVLSDRLGNVLALADPATGVVSGRAVYDSFGGRTVTGEPIRTGFTGREHDAESGLIHFRARAYDPAIGFVGKSVHRTDFLASSLLQRDPIGFAAGDLNLYAYVWNDPIRPCPRWLTGRPIW